MKKLSLLMYLFKKILGLAVVLFGVSILSFIFSNISHVDPAKAYAQRTIHRPTQEQINQIRSELGYDKPIIVQYKRWIKNVLKGDFGMSLLTRTKVSDELWDKFLATFQITAFSMIFTVLISVPISVLAALKKNSIFDKFTNIVTILGLSLPNYWIGFILLIIFAVTFPFFKVVDFGNIRSIILPAMALSLPISSISIRVFRSGLISGYKQDFVTYARARGLSEGKVACLVMRYASPPIITMFFQNIGYCIAGSATIEAVFSWPGIGSYLVKAILSSDLPTINACVLIIASIFILLNFTAEIINHYILLGSSRKLD